MPTVAAQCPNCHKRYNAPASLAGKSVKCKDCGTVFALPTDPSASATGVPAAAAVDSNRTRQPSTTAAAGPAANRSAPPPARRDEDKIGHPSAGFASRMSRNPAAREIELDTDGAAPFRMLRPSVSFDFPGAAALERLLPPLLIAAGVGWLAVATFNSPDAGAGWVAPVRLAAYLLLAVGLAAPLGYLAVRRAAAARRFALPPGAFVRALAVFTFAFALPLVFWLSGETVGMLITGLIFGLVVAAAATWFLFRVQPIEIPAAATAATSALLVSVAVSYFLLMGVSAIFSLAVRNGGTTLTRSPMGPTFAWDVPAPKPEVKPAPRAKIFPDEPETQPLDPPATTAPAVATTTQPAAPATQEAVAGTATTTLQPPPPATQQADSTTKPTAVAVATTNASPSTNPPPPPNTNDPGTATPSTQTQSPIVASLSPDIALGDVNAVYFPARGAGAIAAAKLDRELDTVALLTGSPPAKAAAAAPLSFAGEPTLGQHFALNAAGDTLARVLTFPQLSLELISTADPAKAPRKITLNPNFGTPDLLGFAFGDSVVILWQKGGLHGVEVVPTKPGLPGIQFNVEPVARGHGNPAISPDGRVLAFATALTANGQTGGGIELWDLVNRRNRPLRTLKVPLTTWIKPTGLAFSPNGQFVSAFFEQDGKAALYVLRTGADLPPVHAHVFPAARILYPSDLPQRFTGPALSFLDNATALLLGRVLLDVETGGVLGQLNVDTATAQHVVDPTTVLLQSATPDGKPTLRQLKLKADAIAAKRKELKPKP